MGTRQARPSPFSSWVSPNSSSSSHSSRGSNQLPSSSSSSGQLPSSSSGQPLSSSNSLGQPLSNSSSSGQHLSSSNLHLQQDHSGPLLTSRTHTRAIFRFISKTLPSSSNSLALSRGKPSVSSKPAPLLHARPSRLHLSPSASSRLLSPSASSRLPAQGAPQRRPEAPRAQAQAPRRQEPGSVNDALGQQVVAAEDYVHDPSGDATLSRFQLFQLRKKQEAQAAAAPQA